MSARVSLLFAVTTDPTDVVAASAHSGGWSESHWTADIDPANPVYIPALAQKRALLLPAEAQIIGWRYESFTLAGNKLLPGGTSSGRFRYPGAASRDLNLPQDAVQLSGTASGAPNSARFALRAIPDSQIANGEYQPTPTYKGYMTQYVNELVGKQWGFVGRVKTNATARVLSIVGNVVTLSANVGGIADTDFLRLNRVYDVNGNPVIGSFLIHNVAANVYTLSGLPAVSVTRPSGTARVDLIARYTYAVVTPTRAVSRKIGRPFEQYRGKASKRRA